MRLRQSLRRELEAAAARSRRSVADVTQELLDEALRMRRCPGIYFADEPSGRTAKVGGTGLGVWEVVRDVTRTGEWSHECRRVEWLDGATTAAPGARFAGHNRTGPFRWTRKNEVLHADAPRRLVWRTISTPLFPDSSEWTIELHPADGGTRIVQRYQVVKVPKILDRVYYAMIPAHRDRQAALEADLRRLGDVAASR